MQHIMSKEGYFEHQKLWFCPFLRIMLICNFEVMNSQPIPSHTFFQRERDAVNEWLRSNKTFHLMRDHPWHGSEILAGMWGGWNRYNEKYRVMRRQMLDAVNPIGEVNPKRDYLFFHTLKMLEIKLKEVSVKIGRKFIWSNVARLICDYWVIAKALNWCILSYLFHFGDNQSNDPSISQPDGAPFCCRRGGTRHC